MPSEYFEKIVKEVCNQLAELIIIKNEEYGNSYQDSRKYFKDEKIPLVFHAIEKVKRYEVSGSIDSVWDLAGYAVLEIVSRQVDNDAS